MSVSSDLALRKSLIGSCENLCENQAQTIGLDVNDSSVSSWISCSKFGSRGNIFAVTVRESN